MRGPSPDLICLCDIADYGEPDYSTEDVRSDWWRDGFDLARIPGFVDAVEEHLSGTAMFQTTVMLSRQSSHVCTPRIGGGGLKNF